MRKTSLIAGLLALGVCVGLAGPSRTDEKKDAGDRKAITDKEFAYKASEGGLGEVNLSLLAKDRASGAEVRKFAQQMVEDHGKANKELLALANKKQLPLAPRMGQRHQQMAAKLARLSGAEFDRTYMTGQVKEHEEAEALFEAQAKGGQDQELKAFAEKHLPTIREHLKMARELAGDKKEEK
jgi:putative membrane protein